MISLFDLFKVGIGPSSSHTTGPMKAAWQFQRTLTQFPSVARIAVTLFGSLAWTGKGHSCDKALLLGLSGCLPETIEPDDAERRFVDMKAHGLLPLSLGTIRFSLERDIVFELNRMLPGHSNAMRFEAFDGNGQLLATETWYSVGGGFIVREGACAPGSEASDTLPYPYRSAQELLLLGETSSMRISDLVLANEIAIGRNSDVHQGIDRIAAVMFECIERGMRTQGRTARWS
jgi:L-serine dehydratase